jgi:outer membrane murein-binding lipoprotein Lpp
MKKLMLVIVALALGAAVLPGCKASAEVDDANTSVPAPR